MEGPSGIPYNHVSFPLFVGVLNGFNDRGIACNAHQLLHSRDKIGNYNVATPLLPRMILEQAGSLRDARRIVSSHLPCRSLNLMVTSECERESVVFEMNPETSASISHAGRFMVCTTHFRSPELARFHSGDIRLSQKRLKLVESHLKSKKNLTINDCRILLSDSSNGLKYTHSSPSICNRGTFQSFVFDLFQESVWVSDGVKAPVSLTGAFRQLELRKVFTLPDAVNF
jgi:hypothetical protein